MKRLVRDSIVYFFSCVGIAFIYRTLMKRHGPLVRVIALHDVDDASWFRTIISSLVHDFHIVSPREYEEKQFVDTAINILITFDDGYESWVSTCLPILEENDVRALFFVNSGLLTAATDTERSESFVKDRLMLTPKHVLTFDGARTLALHGHTIGGHTANHTSLGNASSELIEQEITRDKETIESNLGITMKHFAYPFGTWRDYSPLTESRAREAGYSYIYTAEPGFSTSHEAHIPRTLVLRGQTYSSLKRWMYGSYDLFAYLNRLFRSSKEHSKTT